MNTLAFSRVAITACLEPEGFGPLRVWRLKSNDVFSLCLARPDFDPQCDIESLLLGGCSYEAHPGRHTLENHCCYCLSYPDDPRGIQSASAEGRHAPVFMGSSGRCSLDVKMGFLDLLIHVPHSDVLLPRSARIHPQHSLVHGFERLWGLRPVYCGLIHQSDWDTYQQRARAIFSVMEASELHESTAHASTHGVHRL